MLVSLKPTEELLVTLMKLCLNLSQKFLGHLFSFYFFHCWIQKIQCSKTFLFQSPEKEASPMCQAWGGQVTDKYYWTQWVLYKLLPGDLVLTDRCFTVEDSVFFLCVDLVTPPSTWGKKQLSRKEIESARENSEVRIRVGISRQKYTTLASLEWNKRTNWRTSLSCM